MSQAGVNQKFTALTQREKLLTLVSGLAVIILMGFTFYIEPAINGLAEARIGIAAEKVKRDSLNVQLQLYTAALAEDPNAELTRELNTLNSQRTTLENTFANALNDLVSPNDMVLVVEQVFNHANKLTLKEMSSLPPVSVFADDEDMADADLYQHGMQLTFSGGFFDVKHFVEALESQNKQLYWRGIDYQVTEYPLAEVSVEVYTLSTDKAFIGVR